jgi:hypothetical protein
VSSVTGNYGMQSHINERLHHGREILIARKNYCAGHIPSDSVVHRLYCEQDIDLLLSPLRSNANKRSKTKVRSDNAVYSLVLFLLASDAILRLFLRLSIVRLIVEAIEVEDFLRS